ncbi:NADH-dependent butanol dehydrogenase A [subsurface metagenome]
MENFIAYNPVKLHFGKNVTNELGNVVASYGNNILLIYGKGSVKEYGYYDIVVKQLKSANCKIFEFSGIKPNPLIDDVDAAVKYASDKSIDAIVALGGGSVIDSAKIISVCIPGNFKGWDIMKSKVIPDAAVPVIAILTLAATGTEMNPNAVLQNPATMEKIGYYNEHTFPAHSFLDPQFTFSVPPEQTACGIIDLIAHALENFFGKGESNLSDLFIASIIRDAIHYGPLVMKEPRNYDYRANIMWDATCALNGVTAWGKASGDWGVHAIGHQLSMLYDLPHGATLSIAYPAWLKLQLNRIPERIQTLGKLIFNNKDAKETIDNFISFFSSLDGPVSLADVLIGNDKKAEIINLMKKNKVSGFYHKLSDNDHMLLVNHMM